MPNNGGSLANMWGLASAKPKPPSTTNSTAHATVDLMLDDEQGIKKRRAVFDFSDDEEVDNIISIASPETLKILHESELEACVGSMLTSCLVNPRFLQHTKKIRRRTLLTHIKELYNIVRSKDHKKDYLLFHH
ncbi:hypothetical protein ACJX0J_038234, partial [Zea mays]